jgi:hypothetical protein
MLERQSTLHVWVIDDIRRIIVVREIKAADRPVNGDDGQRQKHADEDVAALWGKLIHLVVAVIHMISNSF